MNILEKILTEKRREIEIAKSNVPVLSLKKTEFFNRNCYSFTDFLLPGNENGIITEFKRKSPSKGWIHEGADVKIVTEGYAKKGASALSILTDTSFFGGSLKDLRSARFNELPLLRKDFIIDEYQVIESKANGADIILLIAACLSTGDIKRLSRLARDLDLNVLLEIHSEDEIDKITDTVDVVGINNRDLKSFKVDIENSVRLAALVDKKYKIAESGINDLQTVQYLASRGFSGFLIGERFMKEKDPAVAFENFLKQEP